MCTFFGVSSISRTFMMFNNDYISCSVGCRENIDIFRLHNCSNEHIGVDNPKNVQFCSLFAKNCVRFLASPRVVELLCFYDRESSRFSVGFLEIYTPFQLRYFTVL